LRLNFVFLQLAIHELQVPTVSKRARGTIRLSDVAREADVAISTVSRVVNGSPLVSGDLRQRIEQIIARMGYRPQPRDKRKGVRKSPWPHLKHKVVKIIIYGPFDLLWITNYAPVFSYALHGIEDRLSTYELKRVVERAETPERLKTILDAGGVDGYLILNTGSDDIPAFVGRYPVVAFMGAHSALPCDRVVPDALLAGIMAADFLRDKGCKLCVVYGGRQEVYIKRATCFEDRLKLHGVPVQSLLLPNIIRGSESMHRANRSAITQELGPLLKKAGRPVGIFSLMDMVTPAIYSELDSLGLKIGKSAFVVSCNNERPYLDILNPQPSAIIDIRAEYIGQRAVDQLVRRIESAQAPFEQVKVAPSLILPTGY
jgi:LacI family transcriptional regulator